MSGRRYDELECVGGPRDGDRLRIPLGARRVPIPLPRGSPDGELSVERGVYERATRSEQLDGVERTVEYLLWARQEE